MYGSVEFIAPVEYMVRPPQPASYLFLFECSAHAHQLGYVPVLAQSILSSLDMIPGDSRTLIGFIGFNSKVHFFNFSEDQVTHLVMSDIQGMLFDTFFSPGPFFDTFFFLGAFFDTFSFLDTIL